MERRPWPERLGTGYLGEYNTASAFVFEVVGTFLFLVTILGVTHPLAPKGFGGLAIGLTLVVIHLVGINITGTSVNRRGRSDRRLSVWARTPARLGNSGSSSSPP